MDYDNSGEIEYAGNYLSLIKEFITSFMDNIAAKNDAFLKETFKKIDKDGSGAVDKKELEDFLRSGQIDLGDVDIEQLVKEADTNGDGEIDFEEFVQILRDKR